MPEHVPARVAALAKKEGLTPLDWREYPDRVVIVYVEGPKKTYDLVGESDEPTAEINLADGVDDAEAATAGRARRARRKKKE